MSHLDGKSLEPLQGVDVADDIGNLDRVIGDPDNPDPNRPFVLVGVVSENG